MRVCAGSRDYWFELNDEKIKKKESWGSIIEECTRLKIRPMLLLFERYDPAIYGDVDIEKIASYEFSPKID